MAIEKTYLLGKNITLGCGFDLQAKAPLDSRQVVPEYAGLQALIDGNAAYEGMIVYDEGTKKTYQAQIIDGVLAFREFGLTEAELKDLIASETTAAMEFKGAATALPENPAKGDFYKVTAEFAVGEDTAKVGDSIVYDGAAWCIIPSGDDIEDTWRPVTDVNNDATLTFVAGDKLEKTVAADGTITYKHVAVDAPELLAENEQTRTYITEVETDGFGHITGYKTATENVVDTDTTYEFEGQAEESSVYFTATSSEENADPVTVYLDAYSKNEADGKFVAKETGKSLVADDEIARLANVDNYDDEEVRGLIGDNAQAIEDLADYVGTIPTDDKYKDLSVVAYINKKAEETLAAAQGGSSETAASVKQQLDNYKSENDTRVKAAEDAIDAIEADYLTSEDKTELSNAIAGVKTTAEAAATKTYTDEELAKKVAKADYEADKATFATKTELGDVDKKFANYRTSADQDVIDNGHKERIEALEAKFTGDNSVDAKIAAAVKVEEDARKEAVAGVQGEVDAVEGRMDTAEGKITALETESAKHALKTELEAVDAKFADYKTAEAQKAIDDEQDRRLGVIEGDYLKAADIANFETKENVKKVSDDLAAYIESNDAAVADRYTKAEADGKFALITDAYDDEEVRGLISDNADAIAAEKERAEAAEEGLQSQINLIMNNPDTKDVIDSISEFTQYIADHGEIAEGFRTDIDKNKEDIAANAKAIADQATADAAKYETKEDATAKLGEAKTYADGLNTAMDTRVKALEAIDHDAYVDADAALKAELQAEIDADVKVVNDAFEAYKTSNDAEVAKKANSADVYAKTETYTKAEVEALFAWGEF